MAIYRSDQATVTFSPEVGQGGYMENATIAGSPTDTGLGLSVIAAGDRTVTLSAALTTSIVSSGANLKTFIIIGNNGLAGQVNTGPKEIRRIVSGFGTATITVDTPFGFRHRPTTSSGNDNSVFAINAATDGVADSVTADDKGRFITWFPGVYESVDCPDPEQAFEPRYVLGGVTNRNFYQMYGGNETLSGSIGGMVMLNGFPLRFPLGKVVTTPVSAPSNTGWKINSNGGVKAGDTFIDIDRTGSSTVAAGTKILFGVASSGSAPSGATHSTDSTETYEIREVVTAVASGTSGVMQIWPPLSFDHGDNDDLYSTTSAEYLHTIWEQVALTPVTWNVNILDDAGNNAWQRRYVGGKIGSMTLSAEAGGLLTGGWDGVNFLDMVHNMKSHPDLPANQPMPRYTAMQEIGPTKVGRYATGGTFTRPTTAPYYYSQGVIKMFTSDGSGSSGLEMARISSMSLSISNNPEPKYYVGGQYDGRRAPREQYEGQREYSMSASIATADSAAQGADDSRNLFKELLLAGDYRGTGTSGFRGFGIHLKFTRDIDGDSNDYIEIIIPNDGTATSGGNEQGAFIRTAPHNIGEDSPITADADIAFRSMKVNIRDTEPIYP